MIGLILIIVACRTPCVWSAREGPSEVSICVVNSFLLSQPCRSRNFEHQIDYGWEGELLDQSGTQDGIFKA